MKRTNRILLTVVLLVFACTNIFAYDCEVNGIYYNRISVDEFEVTSGTNKYTGDIVIPETVEYEGAKVDKSLQRLTEEREGKDQGSDLI